ncbi:YqhR family membrane protein [Paenibacillus taichungensis]|uniref:YqhR family membrane protein n=1 Tax=Paenibacillus taichungensis TaxID=484184 RepID=UPI002DB9D46F|nr:YqhR family membrane protein [Paenibacillus taichungensis]MEC0108109.1 YqhR family membrane protein [Paenibacillus taichungensis]MEC0199845.1 YqhR family membrane protein [Paenibacillus taichungensis]
MTEHTSEQTSHKENQRADKGEQKDRGRRPSQRQGQAHYFTKPFPFAVELGFFAGFIWGGLHWLFYLLHFTTVPLGFLAEPFFKHNFIYTAAGHLTGWLFFIVFSVLTSLIYTFTLKKWKGPLPGMGYGIFWWLIIFVLVGPKLDMVKPLNRLTWDSIITEFCFFLLWGLFIGYTVAMEFTDERKREPEQAGA